jgi:hypothetical protein
MHREFPSVEGARVPLCSTGDVECNNEIRGKGGRLLEVGADNGNCPQSPGEAGADNVWSQRSSLVRSCGLDVEIIA